MSAEEQTRYLLGSFRFAKVLTFSVYGDHASDPTSVEIVLDDGIQPPYRVLQITGLGRLGPAPESDWREGWIEPGDPWARVIFSSAIGVVRAARSGRGPVAG